MIGRGRLEPRRDPAHAAHVDQEGDELEGLGGEGVGARLPVGIAAEQLGIVHLQHAGARAGRRDHVIERLERLDHLRGDLARGGAVARVEGRLAATALPRHFDDAAGVLHQLHGGKSDRGADEIDQAGDEQPDPPRLVLGH